MQVRSSMIRRHRSQRLRLPSLVVQGQLDSAQFILGDVRFNLQIRKLIPQALCLDPKTLAFLFAEFDFFLQHDPSLDRNIVFGFQVFQRGCSMASLAFEVVVGHFDVTEFELQRAIGISQTGNLLLQGVLGGVGFRLGLFILHLVVMIRQSTSTTVSGTCSKHIANIPSIPRPRIPGFRPSPSVGAPAFRKPRCPSPTPSLALDWKPGNRPVRPRVVHTEICNKRAHRPKTRIRGQATMEVHRATAWSRKSAGMSSLRWWETGAGIR